jgi:hypothetical protein
MEKDEASGAAKSDSRAAPPRAPKALGQDLNLTSSGKGRPKPEGGGFDRMPVTIPLTAVPASVPEPFPAGCGA